MNRKPRENFVRQNNNKNIPIGTMGHEHKHLGKKREITFGENKFWWGHLTEPLKENATPQKQILNDVRKSDDIIELEDDDESKVTRLLDHQLAHYSCL